VQLFVNSVDHEHGREWLGSPAELRDWLRERELPAEGVDEHELRRAHRLREALRALLRANNGEPLSDEAVRKVSSLPVSVRLDERGRVTLDPGKALLGHVLVVAYGAMLDGTWQRLKSCRQCGWAFYDYSKNRSATWCSMAICGNRLKTRAYRRRKGPA
jgi:predicted RNA-binding Zn ribbon-like protein